MTASRERSVLATFVSPLAWPLVLLYAMVIRLKNAAYDLGIVKPKRLSRLVISIGNLSVGGTGKTPMALLLAELLRKRGWSVDILSRGYGRRSQQVMRVDPHGDWKKFGDEPFLMAQNGVPVYVGADRYQPGQLAESDQTAGAAQGIETEPSAHILDDGFQHRKLARSVDIVLLQRKDLKDEMLPLGRLREPLVALERADICVLRAQDADLKPRVLELMRQTDPPRVWIVERRTIVCAESALSNPAPAALAFCAIGDARRFFQSLRQAGIDVRAEIAFRDHHLYTQKDTQRLLTTARNCGARCFVTTEKDSVRLAGELREQLEKTLPLIVTQLQLVLQDETHAMEMLEAMLTPATSGPSA